MKKFELLLLLILVFPWEAQAKEDWIEKIQSSCFTRPIHGRWDRFSDWRENTSSQHTIMVQAFRCASKEMTDESALLFAFSVDLYEALPYEYDQQCPEGLGGLPSCGRKGYWFEYNRLTRPEFLKPGYTFEKSRAFVKDMSGGGYSAYDFVLHYYKEQYSLSAVTSDTKLDVTDINPLNPSTYSHLQKWLASMSTATVNGIAPWEAEEWTVAHCNDWGGCDDFEFEAEATITVPETRDTVAFNDTTKAIGHTGEVERTPEPESSQLEQAEKPLNPLFIWGTLGAVVLFGIAIGLVRRKRRTP